MNVKLLLSLVAVALLILLNRGESSTVSSVHVQTSAPVMPQGLPLVFDDFEQVNYSFSAEGTGTLGTDVDALFRSNNDISGINASVTYLELSKSATAPTTAGVAIQLSSEIDFSTGTIFVLKTRSESGSFPLTLRLANSASTPDTNGDPSEFFELTAVVSNSKDWEELVFDFGSASGFSSTSSYDRISFILDQGNSGTAFTLDVDDVFQAGALPSFFAPIPESDPEDVVSVFSDSYTDVSSQGFNVFGQAGFEQLDLGGNSVLKYTLQAAMNEGEEATIRLSDLIQASSLGLTHVHFDLWYSAPVDATSSFSLEIWNNPANWEITPILLNASSTPVLEQNRWITVDLSLQNLGAGSYDAIQDLEIKFDSNRQFGEIYLDNLYFYNKFPDSSPSLPIAFEGQQSLSGLLGNEAVLSGGVVDNPDPSGINTSARVYSFTSTEPTTGSSGFFNIFDPNLNLGLERAISFKVWSPEANTKISIRLSESEGNGSPEVTAETVITKVNEWTRVWIDFDELIAPGAQYDQISIFPEFSGPGTLYIDDLDQFDSSVFYAIDTAFEGVLLDEGFDSTGRDGILRIADALTVTELNLSGETVGGLNQIDPAGIGMVSLDGIQFFEALIKLWFEGNAVKSVDLSRNVNLKDVIAWRNGLEEINLTGLRKLDFLGLNFNNLGSIDLSGNEGLGTIGLADNNLTQLVLPRNNIVSVLDIYDNNLEELDISGFDSALFRFEAYGNPLLECIRVNNVETAVSNLQFGWIVDDPSIFSLSCGEELDINAERPVVRITASTPNKIWNLDDFIDSEVLPELVVEELAGSLQFSFEIVYPEGVEPLTTPIRLRFEARNKSAQYSLDQQPNGGGDYYFDVDNSDVSNDILNELLETSSGISASFLLSSNGSSQEDAILSFVVIDDNSFEGRMPGEEFEVIIYGDREDDYILEYTNEGENLRLPVFVEDSQIKEYNLGISGEGSLELGQELITIALFRNESTSDGVLPQEYTLSATDGALSFDIALTPSEGGPNTTPAELTDYSLSNGQDRITLPVGQAKSAFTIDYNQDGDTDKDVFQAELTLVDDNPSFTNSNLSIEAPVLRTIIDLNGGFDIEIVEPSELKVEEDLFRVFEGQTIEILFNPEPGAPLGEFYTVGVSSAGISSNPADSDDFEVLNTVNGGLASFESSEDVQARLRIRTILDDEYTEGREKFELELETGKILSSNFDYSFLSGGGNLFSQNVVLPFEIVDVIPARITTVASRALIEEDQGDFAEFNVSLAAPNTSGKPILVNYEINDQSDAEVGQEVPKDFVFDVDGEEFTNDQGSIVILPGEREARIRIKPNADQIPEENEKLIIQLVEGDGYTVPNSVSFPSSAQIEIINDDVPDFDAVITALGDSFAFEQFEGQTRSGFFRVSLNRANDTGEPIRISFEVDLIVDNPATRGLSCQESIDYTLQTGTNGNFVLIPPESLFADIEVIPCDDLEEEETEQVVLKLVASTPGVDVFTNGVREEATMNIASDECDPDELSPNDLVVTAVSASCVTNVSGAIVLQNFSCLDFDVTVRSADRTRKITLPAFATELTIQDLEFGRYVVEFENLTNDLIPPRFEVNLESFEEVSLNKISLDRSRKVSTIDVSGSRVYQVRNNERSYRFEFDSAESQILEIPLDNGENKLTIKGEVECQGTIQKTIVVDDIVVLPNPTNGFAQLLGLEDQSRVEVHLYTLDGRLVYKSTGAVVNGELDINLTTLQSGTYFGKVFSSGIGVDEFKIIVR